MPNQPSAAPTRKITAAALAGALASILWWVLRLTTKVDPPAEVVAASVVILTVLAGYIVPNA